MALFNYATKEITLKIVYYGPGLSGKTTNLQYLHSILNPENKGRLLSLSTEADRTLFFDFLPVELGKIRDFSIRFQLYTVPGQVRYNATRKVVLKGADAVVFVADSQRDMREQNIESFENMRENLLSNNINPDEVPIVLQYNKRDLGNVASVEELNADLNRNQYHVVESSAISGTGVEDSFRLITRLLLKYISKKHQIEIQPSKEKEAVAPLTPAGKMGTSTEELAAGPSVAAAAEPVATTTPPAPAGDIQA
ncbi:MAG: GTPase domain-containing protein, partial [Nitrospiraceae bacterium]|nr:GTPase domain-containing protein [Nitrospiraceae bacterium]